MASGSGISISSLVQAAIAGDWDEALRNLKGGVNPNTLYIYNRSGRRAFPPLHFCIIHFEDDDRTFERIRVLQLLIDSGADVDVKILTKRPLHLAAFLSNRVVTQILLNAGAEELKGPEGEGDLISISLQDMKRMREELEELSAHRSAQRKMFNEIWAGFERESHIKEPTEPSPPNPRKCVKCVIC